jgi:hypothetical protein
MWVGDEDEDRLLNRKVDNKVLLKRERLCVNPCDAASPQGERLEENLGANSEAGDVMRAQGTLPLEGAGDALRGDEISHRAPPVRGRRAQQVLRRELD